MQKAQYLDGLHDGRLVADYRVIATGRSAKVFIVDRSDLSLYSDYLVA